MENSGQAWLQFYVVVLIVSVYFAVHFKKTSKEFIKKGEDKKGSNYEFCYYASLCLVGPVFCIITLNSLPFKIEGVFIVSACVVTMIFPYIGMVCNLFKEGKGNIGIFIKDSG